MAESELSTSYSISDANSGQKLIKPVSIDSANQGEHFNINNIEIEPLFAQVIEASLLEVVVG